MLAGSWSSNRRCWRIVCRRSRRAGARSVGNVGPAVSLPCCGVVGYGCAGADVEAEHVVGYGLVVAVAYCHGDVEAVAEYGDTGFLAFAGGYGFVAYGAGFDAVEDFLGCEFAGNCDVHFVEVFAGATLSMA